MSSWRYIFLALQCVSVLISIEAQDTTPFLTVLDTTCSDCQDWVLNQLQPLWNDMEFRQNFNRSYDLKFLAKSVTKHRQGEALNKVLNCAHSNLPLEDFLPSLFCWEGHVEAWKPVPGSYRFEEHVVDIDGLMARCMPANSLSRLNECAGERSGVLAVLSTPAMPALPSGFNEVPWLVIGGESFSMGGNDAAVYQLREYLCGHVAAESRPSSCATATAYSFLSARRHRGLNA